MAYSKEIYHKAMAVLESRRLTAEAEATALRARFCRQNPRAAALVSGMAQNAQRLFSAVAAGGDVTAVVEQVRTENLAAQAELTRLLRESGEQADNFEPQYACPLCKDTGSLPDGHRCDCLQKLINEIAAKQLRETSPMQLTSFDEMQLTYYPDTPDPKLGRSPREQMGDVLRYCRWYGENFDTTMPNLLLRGPTGTGKTHVSLAMAAAASKRGAGVIYQPVQQLLHQMEREHFGRAEGDTEQTLLDCDLLVMDDLGTEFSSPFYVSALYNVLNGRLLGKRPTVISTNLSVAQIQDRYGVQITSRLVGEYVPLLFVGADIRQIKLQNRLG